MAIFPKFIALFFEGIFLNTKTELRVVFTMISFPFKNIFDQNLEGRTPDPVVSKSISAKGVNSLGKEPKKH